MTNAIDNAIARLQDLALSCTSVIIKAAPDYPVEDASILPMSIAYFYNGTIESGDASTVAFLPTVINVDFYFSRVSLKQAYQQSDAIYFEYGCKLKGDPTLNGKVDTIIFPIQIMSRAMEWNKIAVQMLRFSIPVKIIDTPQVST
jgi:hypothetical protein